MFWYIDPSHTAVSFSVKHMMVSTVRGSLGKVRGRIELDPRHPEEGDFEIAVEVKGITTGDLKRDGHLRSADFFDAEKYPEISFDVELVGTAVNGQGGQHLGAAATVTIDRTDFGLTWNMPVPNGVLVGEKVKIEVDLEAIDEASANTRGLAA